MKVYLGGRIAGCTQEEIHGWREYVKSKLPGIECVDPTVRDLSEEGHLTPAQVKWVVEGDKEDIDRSDIVLAYCDRPSVGTSQEILYSWERWKTVIAVVPPPNFVSPWITYHSHYVLKSLDDAIKKILELT